VQGVERVEELLLRSLGALQERREEPRDLERRLAAVGERA